MTLRAILWSGLVLGIAVAVGAQVREKRVVPVTDSERQQFNRQMRAGVAVLVGVGKYAPFAGFNPLNYAAADADALATELRAQRYLVVALKDEEATRQSVMKAIEQLEDATQAAGGEMLFFFSGHGFQDGGKNYLALYDSDAGHLSQTGLAVSDVELQMAGPGKATRRVLWIDACRNEPTKGRPARSFAQLNASAGTRILFSTKAGSVSYEDESLRHGVFTYYLLAGLHGRAAGPDGLITFRDLTDYVADAVESYSSEKSRIQTPYEAGEAKGDFLLAKSAGPVTAPVVAQPQPAEAATDMVRQPAGASGDVQKPEADDSTFAAALNQVVAQAASGFRSLRGAKTKLEDYRATVSLPGAVPTSYGSDKSVICVIEDILGDYTCQMAKGRTKSLAMFDAVANRVAKALGPTFSRADQHGTTKYALQEAEFSRGAEFARYRDVVTVVVTNDEGGGYVALEINVKPKK